MNSWYSWVGLNWPMLFQFAILFGSSAPASAAPLTLDEVNRSVDLNYPLILTAKQDLEKARADLLAARGIFDPVLKSTYYESLGGYYKNSYYDLALEQGSGLWGSKFVAGFREGIGSFPVYDSKLQTFDQGEFRVGVEVPLLRGGAIDERRSRIYSSEIGLDLSSDVLVSKQLDLRREAGKKYWDWVAAGRKLQVAKELLSIALDRDRALMTRVKKGDAAQIDYLDNQRMVYAREAARVTASRVLQRSSFDLALFYRDEKGNPLVLGEERLPQSFPHVETEKGMLLEDARADELARAYPDTLVLSRQLDQLEIERSLAKNQMLPKLDLNISFIRDFGANPGTSFVPPSSYPNEFRLSLQFEFPLFLSAARGKLVGITAQEQKLTLLRTLTSDRISIQIRDAALALKAAVERSEFIRKEVKLAELLQQAETKKFHHGDSSLLLINIREQATRDAMTKEIEVLAEFFKAQVEYDTLIRVTAGSAQSVR